MASGLPQNAPPDRERVKLAAALKTLREEARSLKLWLETYEEKRQNHGDEEQAAYRPKISQYQWVIKEMYRLTRPK